jgi:hypothetical protein
VSPGAAARTSERDGMHATRLLSVGLVFLAFAGFLALAGCKEDTPTDLGAVLRTPPDTLRAIDLTATRIDTVFSVPVSMGRSSTPQVGQFGPYTSQVLYAMKLPTWTVDELGDTLRLDTANLTIALGSTLGDTPFDGILRLGLAEVQPDQRGWETDSVLTRLPDLTATPVANDITLDASGFDDDSQLLFDLQLPNFTDYDSVRAAGDSLEVNVAVVLRGFDSGAPGFLEYTYRGSSNDPTAVFNGFSNDDPSSAILTATPLRQMAVVEYDSTYSPGTNWVISDGHRQHTWMVFDELSTVLPPDAFVHRADFVLTQVDSASGLSFGTSPSLGVMIPLDTTQVFSEEQNTLALSFSAPLDNVPGSQVSLNVTAYLLDQQEGTVANSGMILRLSNEGSKVRHFEYHGVDDPDPAVRPRIRIYYGLPADFGDGP